MVDWNAKYSAVDTLLYGDTPSDIINKAKSEYADRLGHVLCLGDGEGRQSRALVRSGFTVTAIDISAVLQTGLSSVTRKMNLLSRD